MLSFKLGIKMQIKKTLAALALVGAVGLSAQVWAAGPGIATYDNTAELNAVQQLAQWAEQLQDNIQSLKNEAQMLLNPGVSAFEEVSDTYGDVLRGVNGISSAINSAANSVEYIHEHFGDADYWNNCVKSGCDHTDMLDSAYNAVQNALDSAIGMSTEIGQKMTETNDKIEQVVRRTGNAGANEGINATLVRSAEVQAMNAQLLSQMVILQQQTLQAQTAYYKAQADKQKLHEEYVKNFFTSPEVIQLHTPLDPNQW